jgi:hypothetical protein
MVQSDALSRRADYIINDDTDNEDVTMLPETLFVNVVDTQLHDLITENIMKVDLVKEAIRAVKENGTPPMKSAISDWKFNDGLLFFQDRCYVPQNAQLWKAIVQKYHESLATGHPGQFQTLELLRRDYWWPGMATFVKNYVSGCATCQQMKVNMHPTAPPLSPIKSTATRPFALVTTDFITDLPISDGFDSIMVVVDHGLTKGVIFIPCNKTIDALGSANLYLQHVYTRFGLPDKIISDRDPRFASKLYQELGKLLGIKLAMSTAYHPQTDGETERVNQELEVYLQMFCSNNPQIWKQFLSTAEFAHNQKFHSAVKNTPFFLMMGSHPRAIPLAYPKSDVPAAEQRIAQ